MSLRDTIVAARLAARTLAGLSGSARAGLLNDLAAALDEPGIRASVLAANAQDVAAAKTDVTEGRLGVALAKRLGLDAAKLDACTDGLRQLALMPELTGRTTTHRELDTGLVLTRVTCPLGVLGVVFEARPDAFVQIAGLGLKSGNALVLKGGREARLSNQALAAVIHSVLGRHHVDARALVLLEDRAAVDEVLGMHDLLELMIARGSSEFIRHVRAHTKIPVMAHADGICHTYLHAPVDPAMAARVVVDAKCSYPAACNAVETLLWNPQAGAALDACVDALKQAGVQLRGCAETIRRHPGLMAATDADWDTEYGALILSVKQVPDLEGALSHIAAHGSRHTEAILTDDVAAAAQFSALVDAACVFHNTSTRFADGYRFGLAAEVGISTDKLHARGPVGVEGLLTYRWHLTGTGQVTTDYGPGGRRYTHRDLTRDLTGG